MSTGTLNVRTFSASLPSSSLPTAPRPCEAMTIRSQPCSLAVAMMASAGCFSFTCKVAHATPALFAASPADVRIATVKRVAHRRGEVRRLIHHLFGITVTRVASPSVSKRTKPIPNCSITQALVFRCGVAAGHVKAEEPRAKASGSNA